MAAPGYYSIKDPNTGKEESYEVRQVGMPQPTPENPNQEQKVLLVEPKKQDE